MSSIIGMYINEHIYQLQTCEDLERQGETMKQLRIA